MTDARFPERYLSDRRVLRLTADEFRGWAFATIWSVSNRTDGVILSDELLLVPFMSASTAQKLEASGLWAADGNGWVIADFPQTQTSRHELEVLDNARRREREKKARQRAAKTGAPVSFSDVPGDGPGGSSRGMSRGHVPEDNTGRTGREEEKWFVDNETGEITDPAPSVPAAWGARTCRVCGTEIPADSPVPWCPKQDDEHNNYRAQAA
ncbi:hypothetical protein GCM10009706_29060 [Curtobacterium citreum]|uniref:Uncharacterized protein n=1 Tax=Curtobacterium citreum TaxID=2036 RepID=A0ABT2HKX0_9MICO|nr:hypothetical protein [Curtobacterium citreum]MCS6523891.1 hypothetical protein [Curtobacterium citreum]TQJ29003.1 hypothetical protein FB462_2910 [Curtobacterium citreum]GGL88579.1 hypothetical protein GCM10009706_29060 [Curtobacterium citreum]